MEMEEVPVEESKSDNYSADPSKYTDFLTSPTFHLTSFPLIRGATLGDKISIGLLDLAVFLKKFKLLDLNCRIKPYELNVINPFQILSNSNVLC